MKKKIVVRNAPLYYKNNSPYYIVYDCAYPSRLLFCDIFITRSNLLFSLISDIKEIRKLNEKCRVVVISEKHQENIISSLFPFVEFIKGDNYSLFDIIDAKCTFKIESELTPLSKREESLFLPLSYALSDKEIASFLNLSVRTVVRTKRRIVEKRGLISSSQLPVFSLAKTLLDE